MIYLVYAPPGTGKTLYAVYRVNRLDPEKHCLITNIEGFTPTNPDLEVEYWQDSHVQKKIVNTPWEEKAKETNKKMVLVLDEAQRFYPSTGIPRGMTNDLLYFLEYHRHYGLDIYLISQSNMSLHIRTKPLVSELVQISKIKSLSGEWRYRKKDPISYQIINKGTFKPTQEDFDSYKSAHNDEGLQDNKTPMERFKKQIALALLAFMTGGIILYFLVSDWITSKEPEPEKKPHQSKSVLNPSPVSPTKQAPAKPIPPENVAFSLASPDLYLTYTNYIVSPKGFSVNINGIQIDSASASHFDINTLDVLPTQNLLVTYTSGRKEIVLPKASVSNASFASSSDPSNSLNLPSFSSVLGRDSD